MSLSGKIALVTGAAQGIGRDIALGLAVDGADLAICDVNLEAAQKTAADIQAKGKKAMALKANVASSADVTAMIDQVAEKFGKIDILVNNAGITRDGLIIRMKEEDWDLVLSINLKGAFNCTKAALKYMTKQRTGTIINIASIVGAMGNAGPGELRGVQGRAHRSHQDDRAGIREPQHHGECRGAGLHRYRHDPGTVGERACGIDQTDPPRKARHFRRRGERRPVPGLAVGRVHHGPGDPCERRHVHVRSTDIEHRITQLQEEHKNRRETMADVEGKVKKSFLSSSAYPRAM